MRDYMNKRATKHKSATENAMLKFLTVSSVSSDGIVKGIIDDIKTAVKTTDGHIKRRKIVSEYTAELQIIFKSKG
jgi:hypothetical protein